MFTTYLFPVTSSHTSKTSVYLDTIAQKRNDFDAWLRKTDGALMRHKTTIEQMPANRSPSPMAIYNKHVIVHQLIKRLRDNIFSNYSGYGQRVSGTSNVAESLTKAEISSRLNLLRVLSLSNDIAEMIYQVMDKDSSITERAFTTKVEQLTRKAHYLPGYGNDLLMNISTELGRLAVAYICLSAYLFLYTTLSHAALIAATVFLGVAVILLGICVSVRYLNQKTDIVDNLFGIIGHLKYNDLNFDDRFRKSATATPTEVTADDGDYEDICRYTNSGYFTESTMDRINYLLESTLGSFEGWRSVVGETQVVSEEVSSAGSNADETDFVMVENSLGDRLDDYHFVSFEERSVVGALCDANYSPDLFSSKSSGSPVLVDSDPDTELELAGGNRPGRK